VTRPKLGPGTPYFADAPATFQAALAKFDTSGDDAEARGRALETLLATARAHDAITLLNLMRKVDRPERERVLDVLSRSAPVPKGYTREQVLSLDEGAISQYWKELGLGNPKNWLVHWKDALE
jgi:hypothetical protein